ncbi:hypothetical protein FACS189487_04260 [Campylobacterota bacterium]|nr:hypothetical protein FACS189487_04260 [Campylobacterota bacterium]
MSAARHVFAAILFNCVIAIGSFAAERGDLGVRRAGDLIVRAKSMHDAGYYYEAVKLYTVAIELDPKFAPAYYNRGVAYKGLNDYSSAIKDWTRTIELSPRYTGAYNERTIAYLLQEKHQEATKDAIRACELGDCKVLEYMSRNNLVRD